MRIKDIDKDTSLSGDEYLLGSDTDIGGKTRNYKLRDIGRYVLRDSDFEGIDQDNILIQVNGLNITSRNIAEAVNQLVEFEVKEKEIYVFNAFKNVSSSSGSGLSNESSSIVSYTYIFAKGKGYYGTAINYETEHLTPSDFVLVNKEEISLPSINGSAPILHVLSNPLGRSAPEAITASNASYDISHNSDVYFQIGNVEGSGETKTYRFIGSPGSYGFNGSAVSSEDLLDFNADGSNYTNTITIKEIPPVLLVGNQDPAFYVNNTMPLFEVGKNELIALHFRKALSNGNLEQTTYLLKRGKGFYGNPSGVFMENNARTIISNSDLFLIRSSTLYTRSSGAISYENVSGNSGFTTADMINTSDYPIEVNSDLYTTIIEDDTGSYRFIGEDGLYGVGYKSCDMKDLEKIDESSDSNRDYVADYIQGKDNTWVGKNKFSSIELEDSIENLNDVINIVPDNSIILNQGRLLFKKGGYFFEIQMVQLPIGI